VGKRWNSCGLIGQLSTGNVMAKIYTGFPAPLMLGYQQSLTTTGFCKKRFNALSSARRVYPAVDNWASEGYNSGRLKLDSV
jgi:hypothetical protein